MRSVPSRRWVLIQAHHRTSNYTQQVKHNIGEPDYMEQKNLVAPEDAVSDFAPTFPWSEDSF